MFPPEHTEAAVTAISRRSEGDSPGASLPEGQCRVTLIGRIMRGFASSFFVCFLVIIYCKSSIISG